MDALKLIFFSLFTHLAVGMLLPLLFISVSEIGTMFFRFISGLSIVLLLLAFWAHPFAEFSFALPFATQIEMGGQIFTLLAASIFFILLTIFFLQLGGKIFVAIAVVLGLAAMSRLAFAFPMNSSVPDWMMAGSFVSSALILGSVLGTMITGHWYLVNRKLTIRPLQMATWIFIAIVGLRFLVVAAIFAVLLGSSQLALSEMVQNMLSFSVPGMLFWARVAFGLIVPFVFGLMIWSSVKVRNTQSATGILYATIVFVVIGEAFSKYLYLFTGIPV
jgi:hypothetical protein